jgi:hypothetical protein
MLYHDALGREISRSGDESYWLVRAGADDEPGANGALVAREDLHRNPVMITDPQAPQRAEQQLREASTYFDFTWALVLFELPGHRARLLVRTRANYSPRALRFLTLPLGLFDATYGVAQLRANARRAESPQLSGP